MFSGLFCRGRYPPYSESKMQFLASLMRKRRGLPTKYLSHLFAFGLGVAFVLITNALMKVNWSSAGGTNWFNFKKALNLFLQRPHN